MSIVIVTEANEQIATGHLMESIVCATELLQAGYNVKFWINHNAAQGLKERISFDYKEYEGSIEQDDSGLIAQISMLKSCIVLFNLREISETFLHKLRREVGRNPVIICIDEFGNRELSADIIVNPMIDPYYWNYGRSHARLYCGEKYLILPEMLEQFHKKMKLINEEIQNIVISMGGVDPWNYTSVLIEVVPQCFPCAQILVVLGAGNLHKAEITQKVQENNQISLQENVSNLPELVFKADLLFCAGGNTLHEAACMGTPAIIVPSMPHEVRTANCFEQKGFGLICCGGQAREIEELCNKMKSYQLRSHMMMSGKTITDGLGRKRIHEIIKTIESKDKTLISVIIPFYNTKDYIDKCLESVTTQTYVNLEIIIVDDGSREEELEYCRKWVEKDNRIIIVKQNHKGAGAARNLGMKNARGRYLSFIDSDDWLDENFYKKMFSYMIETNSDIVFSDICRIVGKEEYYILASGSPSHSKVDIREFLMYGTASICNSLSDINLWKENQLVFPEMPFEDAIVKPLLLVSAKKVGVYNEALYFYRGGRPGSCTSAVSDRYKFLPQVFDCLIEEFKLRNLYKDFESALYVYIKNTLAYPRVSLDSDKKLIEEERTCAKTYLEARFPKYVKRNSRLVCSVGSYNLGRARDYLTLFQDYTCKNQFVSIVSLMSHKPLNRVFKHKVLFRQQMLERDLNKLFWHEIKKNKLDYLLLDFIEEKSDLLEYKGGIYTKSEAFEELESLDCKAEMRTISRFSFECNIIWEKSCLEFIDVLKDLYRPNQIVLVKNYLTKEYGNRAEKYLFDDQAYIEKMNHLLGHYYDFFQENFQDILVVEGCSKENCFTDEFFRFGKEPWNYNSLAFRELAKKIDRKLDKQYEDNRNVSPSIS